MFFLKTKKKNSRLPLAAKVSFAYVICGILQRCMSFITLPLFTRILTTEQYGQYTVYISWSGIIMIFLTLNLAYGSFSKAMSKYEDKRDEYISSAEGICLLLSLLFLLVYFPLRSYWNKLFELPTVLVIVMVFEILSQTAILFWSGKKRFEFKYKSVIAITLGSAILSPLLAFLLMTGTEEKGVARILGYACVNIVFGGYIFFLNIYRGKNLYNKDFWKYAFSFNIPLLTYYLSQVIFNQSDRIMISHISGSSDAAMYGVAYNLSTILVFVLNAINNSYVPWYYDKIKIGRQSENKKIASLIAVIMSVLILTVIWFAPEIILIFAGEKYESAIGVVAPVSMSLLLLCYSQFFINVEFYYECKKFLAWASVAAALINIALNALLIPIFGFLAAGYTTLASYIIFVLSNYWAMKNILKQRGLEDNAYNYKMLIIILVVFTLLAFLGVVLYDLFVVRLAIILVCAFILFFNAKKYDF